jgi:3-phenylpropionate/trans-cinnamate dioxygenase ferredoxin reductase subunit
MPSNSPVVIVGAGLAGATAAQTLRESGFDGPVMLLGSELERPYARPELSKGYLQGSSERASLFVHEPSWYDEHQVELRLGATAVGLDPSRSQLSLSDGTELFYDRLLLTTGSSPRKLTVPGSDLPGVLSLRTLGDSDQLRKVLASIERLVVVGGGWIGLEVAAAARAAGVSVTILERGALPLERVLGPEVAAIFADLHRRNGVDLRVQSEISEVLGSGGVVRGVRLSDGEELAADAVLAAVGIIPNTQLAVSGRLSIDNGIRVNERLQSSAPEIFAAGDVANAFHPFLHRSIRVEHWANALHQPVVAARAMMGGSAGYDRLPYFYTDQYDLSMEYIGYVEPDSYDRVVFRGDPTGGEFLAFWLSGGRILAGMNVNVWDVVDTVDALIRTNAPVDISLLTDPDVPLESLVPDKG